MMERKDLGKVQVIGDRIERQILVVSERGYISTGWAIDVAERYMRERGEYEDWFYDGGGRLAENVMLTVWGRPL